MTAIHVFNRSRRRSNGITVTEMLIAVAILAVLAAIAAPNLSELFIRNRLETAANEFMAALSLTRSEAIRRGQEVAIRRTSPTSRDWTQGWEIYVELDAAGASGYCQRDTSGGSEEQLINVGQPLLAPLSLRSTYGMRNCIVFSPDGRSDVRDFVTSPADDAFILCHGGQVNDDGKSRSRAIVVSRTGRIRRAEDLNGDGFAESDRGNRINDCNAVMS